MNLRQFLKLVVGISAGGPLATKAMLAKSTIKTPLKPRITDFPDCLYKSHNYTKIKTGVGSHNPEIDGCRMWIGEPGP